MSVMRGSLLPCAPKHRPSNEGMKSKALLHRQPHTGSLVIVACYNAFTLSGGVVQVVAMMPAWADFCRHMHHSHMVEKISTGSLVELEDRIYLPECRYTEDLL